MQHFCISAISSNQGKTILTTALLYHFRNSVRPFKIGPDYIDPQFHQVVSSTPSINLDSYIMNNEQVKWIYNHYSDKKISIIEGVMGFYDGDDKGCSAYSITKLLNIPTILLLDASGSYITISAVLQGILKYKKDNTIKAIVLNNISSNMHFQLIKKIIQQDHPSIIVLGWIEKNLEILKSTHLGLDLNDLEKIKNISQIILKNIDIHLLEKFTHIDRKKNSNYPFPIIPKINKTISIVRDKNFSFLYFDNLTFLQEVFQKVYLIDATKDEEIKGDFVYICGGYIETPQHYEQIKNSHKFKSSLKKHSLTKPIYAECAGLLYLAQNVDDKNMSGILDVSFTLTNKRQRLGYYFDEHNIKGHSFHYTKALNTENGFNILKKSEQSKGIVGSWKKNKVLGTYLHTMFRNNPTIIINLLN